MLLAQFCVNMYSSTTASSKGHSASNHMRVSRAWSPEINSASYNLVTTWDDIQNGYSITVPIDGWSETREATIHFMGTVSTAKGCPTLNCSWRNCYEIYVQFDATMYVNNSGMLIINGHSEEFTINVLPFKVSLNICASNIVVW